MLGRTYDDQVCSIARTLEVLGERWTLLIVRDALLGLQRFDEFQESHAAPAAQWRRQHLMRVRTRTEPVPASSSPSSMGPYRDGVDASWAPSPITQAVS